MFQSLWLGLIGACLIPVLIDKKNGKRVSSLFLCEYCVCGGLEMGRVGSDTVLVVAAVQEPSGIV